jgi:hypothetical protein
MHIRADLIDIGTVAMNQEQRPKIPPSEWAFLHGLDLCRAGLLAGMTQLDTILEELNLES